VNSARRAHAEGFDVVAEAPQRGWGALYEIDVERPSRQRLQAQGTGTGEYVDHSGFWLWRAENAENRLSDPPGGGAGRGSGRSLHPASAHRSADDPHGGAISESPARCQREAPGRPQLAALRLKTVR